MPRPKINSCRKFYEFNALTGYNTCTVVENDKICGKVIKTDHGSNLASHIKSTHKSSWEKVKCEKEKEKKSAFTTINKQPNRSILTLFNPKINIIMSKEKLMSSCLELCTVNGRPFSIVEDSGFRKIIEPITEGLGNLCITRKILREETVTKCHEIVQKISKEVEGKLICLKVDGLTHLNRSFLGVNAQFICNGKIVLRTLAVYEMFDRHTAENLKSTIIEILGKFNISIDQIYSCTTDNGRNMLKCIEILNIADDECDDLDCESSELEDVLENFNLTSRCVGVRCAAHTLQLAINAFLKEKEMDKTISEARNVIKKLRTPNITYLLKREELSKPPIDCITRWSSTFNMLAALIDVKIKEFCCNLAQANCDFLISEKSWAKISEAVETLRPANTATKILQKEQLTFGDAYDAWFTCTIELQKIKTPFSYNLLDQIKKKENMLFENDAFIAAIFMDPRWKVVLKPPMVERAIQHILQVAAKMKSISISDANFSSDDENTSAEASSSVDCVEAILKNMEKENVQKDKTCEDLRDLLYGFNNEKRVARNVNVLDWWKEKMMLKPKLYELATVLLAVPATQVSVERLFSGVKFIMSPSRNRLDYESLNAIVIIRSNKDLF